MTKSVIWLAIIGIVLYDIAIVILKGPVESVSWELLDLSRRWPIIPFALGVAAGHVFWPLPVPFDTGAKP